MLRQFRLKSALVLILFLGMVLGMIAQHQHARRREAELRAQVASLDDELMLTRQTARLQQFRVLAKSAPGGPGPAGSR